MEVAPGRQSLTDVAELHSAVVRSERIWIDVVASGPSTLLVEQFCFPGYRVDTRSGPAPAALRCRDDGRLLIDLPEAGRYLLRVRLGLTLTRLVGTSVSLVALAIWLFLLWHAKRGSVA